MPESAVDSSAAAKEFEKNIGDGDVSILLTNKSGSYALFSSTPASRYEGVFFRNGGNSGKMIKLIESLFFQSPVSAITNRLWGVSIKRGELSQTMFMPLNHDALVVELSTSAEFELLLDAKISEDNRVWGRNYEVSNEDKTIVVKFSKKNDARDDNSSQCSEFEVFLALYAEQMEYLPLQTWDEHFYRYDEERHSPPFSRWVFKACRIRAKDFVCAWSLNKKDAIASAKNVFESRDRLRRERENYVHSLISKGPKISNPEVALARQCSVNALDCLTIQDSHIIAGLPWFYQHWARDEIICTKALMLENNYAFAKKILFSYLSKINKDGLLLNMSDCETSLFAFDAIGWLFFRLNELLSATARKKSAILSEKEKAQVVGALETCLSAIFKNRFVKGLVQANRKETWMDTEFGQDTREGAPIELQAMMLFMCKMFRKLSGKKDLFSADFESAVKKNFFKNKILLDVAGSNVVRPNFFIAAYIYPELLSKKEWEDCISSAIPKLWLDWGGFASIEKKNPLFTDTYSGEDNKSYHRGDSWFWLNNLAAIVMHTVAPKKFESHISKIVSASSNEILYEGATGFAAEVSSAKELSSKGCVAQAWSSATFIELADELFSKK